LESVGEGTKRANETAESLTKIVANIADMSDMIKKIYDSSIEQREAVGQATIGLQQISVVVQSNSATSEESAAASQELNSQAETLQHMIAEFKTK
jgi:methyl-accepting chemotaxis protein